jgi:LPXTG-motif cell wall-anchored protein
VPASNNGGLPLTGTAIGGLVLTGVIAIASGAALLWLRRRRDAVPVESE